MLKDQGYPLSTVCELLELPRSTYYYQSVERDESELEDAIEAVTGKFPTYGTRRVSKQLGRPPHQMVVNRKRTQRKMRENGQLVPQKRRKRPTTDSDHPYPRYPNLVKDLEITHPEHVWVSDITYIRLLNGFVYLAIILDVFTRSIRGWCLGHTLDQELTLMALRAALATNSPQIHHSDQGVQYAANSYTGLLKAYGI